MKNEFSRFFGNLEILEIWKFLEISSVLNFVDSVEFINSVEFSADVNFRIFENSERSSLEDEVLE